jgi:hypothetical protein
VETRRKRGGGWRIRTSDLPGLRILKTLSRISIGQSGCWGRSPWGVATAVATALGWALSSEWGWGVWVRGSVPAENARNPTVFNQRNHYSPGGLTVGLGVAAMGLPVGSCVGCVGVRVGPTVGPVGAREGILVGVRDGGVVGLEGRGHGGLASLAFIVVVWSSPRLPNSNSSISSIIIIHHHYHHDYRHTTTNLSVGALVWLIVGCVLGADVGGLVGPEVGPREGLTVGCRLGIVGAVVGPAVGLQGTREDASDSQSPWSS